MENDDGYKTGHTLDDLDEDDLFTDFIDPMHHYQAAHIVLLSQKGKQNQWEDDEDPTEEYLKKKERSRLEKLKRDRGHCISYTFSMLYHVTVIFNFVYSWMDSFKITLQEAKLQTFHLQGVFNCMEVIHEAYDLQFSIEIIHAVLSACVLFAGDSSNASLCIAFVFAQAIHTLFKGFQMFMQARFLNGTEQFRMGTSFLLILICNILASIVVTQKFYDLTDRIRTRTKYVDTSIDEGGSMNDEIIYQNQSLFLQRKYIVRQAIAAQVYRILLKMEEFTKKGNKPDPIEMYKEIKATTMALTDSDDVPSEKVIKFLKKATAQRLEEIEKNPKLFGVDKIRGSFNEFFLVRLAHENVDRRRTNTNM